jgi:predicted RNase H-like HicB family nuclease
MKYLIIVERTRTGYSAYSPDLDGCVAAARTAPGVKKLMREAIKFHVEGLKKYGYKVPRPRSSSSYVEVS